MFDGILPDALTTYDIENLYTSSLTRDFENF
jgi:hypothetical protein